MLKGYFTQKTKINQLSTHYYGNGKVGEVSTNALKC